MILLCMLMSSTGEKCVARNSSQILKTTIIFVIRTQYNTILWITNEKIWRKKCHSQHARVKLPCTGKTDLAILNMVMRLRQPNVNEQINTSTREFVMLILVSCVYYYSHAMCIFHFIWLSSFVSQMFVLFLDFDFIFFFIFFWSCLLVYCVSQMLFLPDLIWLERLDNGDT